MSILSGKKVLLGVTGGIAAYKTPLIVRLLIKQGAQVKVVMTPSATDFVTPLTLSTLSQNPVLSSFTEEGVGDHAHWNNHVELALWADFMLIAPVTSNTLSSMVNARCNNLLLACYLSAQCPVFIAPAMDLDMYAHPANQKNMALLESFGHIIFPAQEGFLASGLEGKGRMMEPEDIIATLTSQLEKDSPLYGKSVLITAGPTHEAIDPVRFIGNHSSGKMGFALAEEAARQGAKVVLISGPTALSPKNSQIELIRVVSAQQMHTAVFQHYHKVDIAIAAAAVADFTPAEPAQQKIKKKTGLPEINLIPTVDILADMGQQKKQQFLLGFALETENELDNAMAKCTKKNADAIVLNSLKDTDAGFGGDQNKITFIQKNGTTASFELKPKTEVAVDIFAQITASL
ncbi:MAG: bifunctional phosphopantothenoylcysteine decarboxylase/phosphopantothenate--cysteine ligase CoaBC [Flavobacteriaceae bacterium]|nr:bifunctional phosphopantothenoylcysteine decarboxylase/phosphopantothenate--cysteine ligase CoaBC [Flavobacteriaceae bacterium]